MKVIIERISERTFKVKVKTLVDAYIKVFITKTQKFRAEICEAIPTYNNPRSYVKTEIIVGGQEWNNGKLKEYHKSILEMCDVLMEELDKKLESYYPEEYKSKEFENEVDYALLDKTVRDLVKRGAPLTSVISTLGDLMDIANEVYDKILMEHEKKSAQEKALEKATEDLRMSAKIIYDNEKKRAQEKDLIETLDNLEEVAEREW